MVLYSARAVASAHAFSSEVTAAAGVLAGAITPPAVNDVAGWPSSFIVRTSGSAAMRASDSTARTGRLLAAATAGVSAIAITVPLSRRLRHWARASERHAQPLGADRLEHGEHAEMRLAGEARMAVDEVFGLRLGEADEFFERLERRLRSRDQHIGGEIGQADVAEAIHRVGQLLHMRLRRQRIVRGQRDGIAVGCGPAQLDEAKRAGGAGLVDDDHGLAERLGYFVL